MEATSGGKSGSTLRLYGVEACGELNFDANVRSQYYLVPSARFSYSPSPLPHTTVNIL
jgi:hypothetical protein